jgi:DnaJ family protein C protein 19
MATASGGRAVILFALVAGGLLFWMWRRGELKTPSTNDAVAAVAGLAGLLMLLRGEMFTGALLIGAAGAYFGRRRIAGRFGPVHVAMRLDEARRVLDVPLGADALTIRAAHRGLVARVHPDQGGSPELAARVNAARDVLLSELDRRRRG